MQEKSELFFIIPKVTLYKVFSEFILQIPGFLVAISTLSVKS